MLHPRRPNRAGRGLILAWSAALGLAACSAGSPAPTPEGPVASDFAWPTPLAGPGSATGFGAQAPAADAADDLADFCRQVSRHPILGDQRLLELEAQMEPYRGKDPRQLDLAAREALVKLETQLGQQRLYAGQFGLVMPVLDAAVRSADDGMVATETLNEARMVRAVAHLRMGEVQNCLSSPNPYLCLLFVGPAGAHPIRDQVARAVPDLTAILDSDPSNMKARWLLNVAHMLAGTFPDGVPEQWRIPPERFESLASAPRFRNIAPELGLNRPNLLGGSMMEDLDGDGNLDILFTTYHPCRPVTYFHNDGDGRFSDRSAAAGLSKINGGFNVVQTDYNNDGHLDLFITRGGWQSNAGRMRPSLLRNNGDGSFVDIAREAGFGAAVYPTQVSVWADYDADGDLDVYLANEIGDDQKPYPSQLFRNNGDDTFTDVAAAAGVTNDTMAKGAAWGDYDNDGDPDLYVSNIGPNRLYRNQGDGTFVDVAPELRVTEPAGRSFVPWFFDYDNDGWLDLFVGGYQSTVADVAAYYLGQTIGGVPPRLYHNTGGAFEDVTAAMGLERPMQPMGANFGDIDNDGWPDFYLGTGDPEFATLEPNLMFRNDAGRAFVDVTQAAGVGHLPKGHGVGFGDLDNDGDQDIVLEAGGFYPGDIAPNVLFQNPGTANHWLTLRLVGQRSNRAAIGARLKVVVDDGGTERAVYSEVNSGASFGASSLQQELGLGGATRVKRIEVTWPTTGRRQVFEDLPVDTFLEIREDEAEVREHRRPPIPMAAPVSG